MSTIVPFSFSGAAIRVIDIDGEPWFVGKDVAEALGYANTSDAINTHCKGVAKYHPLKTAGGMQEGSSTQNYAGESQFAQGADD